MKYDVDIILDGEMVSWDNYNKETLSSRQNRSVATARKNWLKFKGKIEEIDSKLHNRESEKNILPVAISKITDKQYDRDNGDIESGSVCWLKYVIFDILYVGGPDASRLLCKANNIIDPFSHRSGNCYIPGSIINMELYERKAILYELIQPCENEVEIIESYVVRPNGNVINSADYFCNDSREYGYTPTLLDSVTCVLDEKIPNLSEIDDKRRDGCKDIHRKRADALEALFSEVVELRGEEGLLLKDLSSPYFFGQTSEKIGYWRKLKIDYHVKDIDVVVLGASFASGLSRSGMLNSFLVGCLDPESDGDPSYLTLCKVSGRGTSDANIDNLLQYTGFRKAIYSDESLILGKWFKLDKNGKELPDFISNRSFQRCLEDGDETSWKFNRKDYPDVWIRPEHSFVLTINARDVVVSDSMSSGVSLRCPHICKVRLDGIDGDKKVDQVETVKSLHELYFSESNESFKTMHKSESRFLTSKSNNRNRQKTRNVCPLNSLLHSDIEVETCALNGLAFTVFEGRYELDNNLLELARTEGWLDDALQVKGREDVINFIKRHAGSISATFNGETDIILGGEFNDARVANHVKAINAKVSIIKNSLDTQEMLDSSDILKWGFVYHLVKRWRQNMENKFAMLNDNDFAVKKSFHHLISLRDEHYLLYSAIRQRSKMNHGSSTSDTFSLNRDLKRAPTLESSCISLKKCEEC